MSAAVASQSLKKMHQLAENLKIGLDDTSISPTKPRPSVGEVISPAARVPYRELQTLYEELTDKLRKVANEKDELTVILQQRQEAFARTEEKYKEDMRTLEVRLQKMGMEDRSRMDPLRSLHGNIQDTISSIQNKTARVLQDQERDLIRAFRARLADVTVELENERKKNESGSAEWVARCRKLTEELEWLRDLTDKLTSENKSVLKDNRRFKRQMKTQEEDREFLIKQLVSVKKENARLRYSFDQLMAGNIQPAALAPTEQQAQQLLMPGSGTVSSITGLPMSQSKGALRAGTPVTDQFGNRPGTATPFGGVSNRGMPSRPQSAMSPPTGGFRPGTAGTSRPGTAAAGSYPSTYPTVATAPPTEFADKEFRYKALVNKLQRQVEDGAKAYRQLRTQYTQELASRTELQSFLKKCIDDVRQDMAERGRSATLRRAQGAHRAASAGAARAKQLPPPPVDPRSIPLAEFTPQDRINVMEWLLSQDQVIFMLYEKIFPQRPATNTVNQQDMDFEKLASQTQPNAPGSLFNPPQQQFRPSSSPVYQSTNGTQQARPQTVGPGQTRSKINSSNPQSQSQTNIATTATSSSSQTSATDGSKYERPIIGNRPLSGFVDSSSHSNSSHPSSTQPPRPHTASATTTTTNFQAEVEAELRQARAQRPTIEDEEDDGDEPDQHSYQDSAALANLSEDEDEDRQLYEQKEEDDK